MLRRKRNKCWHDMNSWLTLHRPQRQPADPQEHRWPLGQRACCWLQARMRQPWHVRCMKRNELLTNRDCKSPHTVCCPSIEWGSCQKGPYPGSAIRECELHDDYSAPLRCQHQVLEWGRQRTAGDPEYPCATHKAHARSEIERISSANWSR